MLHTSSHLLKLAPTLSQLTNLIIPWLLGNAKLEQIKLNRNQLTNKFKIKTNSWNWEIYPRLFINSIWPLHRSLCTTDIALLPPSLPPSAMLILQNGVLQKSPSIMSCGWVFIEGERIRMLDNCTNLVQSQKKWLDWSNALHPMVFLKRRNPLDECHLSPSRWMT